jgi:hypothetical protein
MHLHFMSLIGVKSRKSKQDRSNSRNMPGVHVRHVESRLSYVRPLYYSLPPVYAEDFINIADERQKSEVHNSV